MTCKISRPVFALVLALGMLAAVASPSHAALSTAERAAPAPAPEQTTLAVVAAPETLAVAAPAAKVATPVAAVAAPVKTVAPKAKPQRLAYTPRKGYPCH